MADINTITISQPTLKKTDETKGILTTEQVIFKEDLLREEETLVARLEEVKKRLTLLK